MKTIYFTLLFSLYANLIYSQWVQSNGPWAGDANCFTKIESTILAGTNGDGIFVSTDGGIKWKKSDFIGISNNIIRCFLWSGTYLFAGTDGGVFLSVNNGSSWFAVNSGIYSTSINCMTKIGNTIYAGTNAGVFITTNNGASWDNSSYGIANYTINSLLVVNNILFAGTDGGVFKSLDNGSYWTSANFGLISQKVNILYLNESTIFAGTSSLTGTESIYKTTNGGELWIPSGLTNHAVFSLTNISTFLYAGSNKGIYRSSDNGITWSGELGMSEKMIKSIYSFDSNLLLGTLEGIFVSTNGGTVWNSMGYNSVYVWDICGKSQNLWATSFLHKIYLSTNNGDSWFLRSNGLESVYRYSNIESSDSVTYVTFQNNNLTQTGIYKTTNNGINWDFAYSYYNTSITFINNLSDTLLLLGFYYREGKYGLVSFKPFPYEYTNRFYNKGVYDSAVKDNFIFVSTGDGIFRSADGTQNWENMGINGYYFAVSGENIYVTHHTGIYHSNDNGINWELVGLNNKSINCIAAFDNSVIAGVYDDGFFYSSDNGKNWKTINEGLDSIPNNIVDITVKDGYIFTAIDNLSIWKRSIANITGLETNQEKVPEEFVLYQNYPNPFNPTTTIKFSIPQTDSPLPGGARSGLTTLKIYDILGNEVATLVNEPKAPGNYEIKWNASGFASGVYFYRLQYGQFIKTMKLSLIK